MHCLWFLDLLVPVAPVLLLTTLHHKHYGGITVSSHLAVPW